MATFSPFQVNASDPAQFRQIVRQHGSDLRVSIPAILTDDMDAGTQTVSAQIAVQERAFTSGVNPGTVPATGPSSSQAPPTVGPKWVTLQPVLLVPIIVPRGGGYSLTLPLKKGDEGMLIFCDCCFDLWWQRGGVQNQVGNHRHEFWDCGFLPGMWSQPNALDSYSTTSMQLRTDDGTTTVIDVSQDGVTITGKAVIAANGGTPQFLVTADWMNWFTTNFYPWAVSHG